MDNWGLYLPCLPGWDSARLPQGRSDTPFTVLYYYPSNSPARVRHGKRHFYSRGPRMAQGEMVEDEGHALCLSDPLGSYDYLCDER